MFMKGTKPEYVVCGEAGKGPIATNLNSGLGYMEIDLSVNLQS